MAFDENDYWQVHLYLWFFLKCETCGADYYPECWEGLPAGEPGAEEFARRASLAAQNLGWILQDAPEHPRFYCPACSARLST